MVERIQLLRNIGQFDSVNPGQQTTFSKLALIYAENLSNSMSALGR
jgi:hypothetical protein